MPFGPTVCQRHARTKPKSSERLHKPGLGSAKPSGLARTSTTELRSIPLTRRSVHRADAMRGWFSNIAMNDSFVIQYFDTRNVEPSSHF